MTKTIRIAEDGTVTTYTERASDLARQEFEGLIGVVTLRAGAASLCYGVLVGTIHDFGMQRFGINTKAWSLYGRSPLYGPVFVSEDDGGDLDEEFLTEIERPTSDGDLAVMRLFLAHEDFPGVV